MWESSWNSFWTQYLLLSSAVCCFFSEKYNISSLSFLPNFLTATYWTQEVKVLWNILCTFAGLSEFSLEPPLEIFWVFTWIRVFSKLKSVSAGFILGFLSQKCSKWTQNKFFQVFWEIDTKNFSALLDIVTIAWRLKIDFIDFSKSILFWSFWVKTGPEWVQI